MDGMDIIHSPESNTLNQRSISDRKYLNLSVKHPCDFCNAWECDKICNIAMKYEQYCQKTQIN